MVEVADDRQASPTVAAERLEQQTRVQAAVQELPETLRPVVVLHYSGGLSLRQVAAAMEINVGTVKSRLNSALVHLRVRLAANEQSASEP
jgi:RNA polymerase sigma-70 factor (ECF subfamily)